MTLGPFSITWLPADYSVLRRVWDWLRDAVEYRTSPFSVVLRVGRIEFTRRRRG